MNWENSKIGHLLKESTRKWVTTIFKESLKTPVLFRFSEKKRNSFFFSQFFTSLNSAFNRYIKINTNPKSAKVDSDPACSSFILSAVLAKVVYTGDFILSHLFLFSTFHPSICMTACSALLSNYSSARGTASPVCQSVCLAVAPKGLCTRPKPPK